MIEVDLIVGNKAGKDLFRRRWTIQNFLGSERTPNYFCTEVSILQKLFFSLLS